MLPTVTLLRSRFVLRRFFVVALVSLFAFFMGHTPMIQAQTPAAPDQSTNDDILFISQIDGRWHAYVMNSDGSNKRPVSKRINFPGSLIDVYWAVFSPDRSQIALAVRKIDSTVSGQEHRLYRVNADGKGRLKLLWSGTSDYLSPVWSPDGNQVLFSVRDDSGSDLYIINSDGSGLRRLTEGGRAGSDSLWSPSGLQILFLSRVEGNSALSVINANGTGFRELASGYSVFDWSPDGEHIVFASDDDGVSLINQDGSGLERLTKMGAYGVTWSPDGEHIAFVSSQEDQEFVYMINPDGSELTQLTDDLSIGFTCLTWQPDSKQLIADGIPDSGLFDPATNIYSIQIDGSGETMPLTDETGIDVIPNCTGVFG